MRRTLEVNVEAKHTDAEITRKKLAEDNRYLKLDGNIVSMAFRAYHKKSAEAMKLDGWDRAAVMEGALLIMIMQALLIYTGIYAIMT